MFHLWVDAGTFSFRYHADFGRGSFIGVDGPVHTTGNQWGHLMLPNLIWMRKIQGSWMIDGIDVQVGDLVMWSHPIASDTGETGVVVQIEDCDDVEEVTGEPAPCRVWVLWSGKTKMAWTLPEMLKRIDKLVQN